MHTRVSRHLPRYFLHHCKSFILICWLAGLILGIAYSYRTQPLATLMRGAPLCSVTIVGLGAVLLLPYLLTVSAVLFSQPGILLTVAFSKAFLYGTCAAAVNQAFADAGWLVRSLLLFSDNASLPVLFWLLWHCADADAANTSRAIWIAGIFLAAIGIMDFVLIAPLLESVM